MKKNKKIFSVFLIVLFLFIFMTVSVSARGQNFDFTHIDISFIDQNGVSTRLNNQYIDEFSYTITTDASSPNGYYSGDDLFTNDIIISYCSLVPASLRNSVAFDLQGLYNASSVEVTEESVFYFQFLYITEFYFNDLNVNFPDSPVKAYVDLGVVAESGLGYSGSVQCGVIPTLKGYMPDPTDQSITLYVYDCLCAVSGSQLINIAQSIDPEFSSLNFSNIRFIQSGLSDLDSIHGFGFSEHLYVSDVPSADASLEQQRVISDQLNYLITMQSGIDTSSSINNFNSVDENFQELEDQLIDDFVGDNFQSSVNQGDGSLTIFSLENSSAFALIGALLGKLLNFQGLSLIITILLTITVCGVLFNFRLNSIGGVVSSYERKRSSKKK